MATSSLVRPGAIVLDCPDHVALAGFYAALLGWPASSITSDEDWATLPNPDGGFNIEFQLASDYQAPTWPDPARPQMFHFDLTVSDLAAAARHAVDLGAKPLDLSDEHPTFQVYADPVGHPFCLCTG
jgi:hypothetical protein